jgi:type I restriction-modification system DNA methylase subunit
MATSEEYGYDTEKNNYPLELLNEDIERMINTDKEFIDAFNDLKAAAMEKEYYYNNESRAGGRC